MHRTELARRLKAIRERAPHKEMTVRTHLFGIEYSNELQGYSMNDLEKLMKLADTPVSMAIEMRKCIKLAEFVTVKKGGRTR